MRPWRRRHAMDDDRERGGNGEGISRAGGFVVQLVGKSLGERVDASSVRDLLTHPFDDYAVTRSHPFDHDDAWMHYGTLCVQSSSRNPRT